MSKLSSRWPKAALFDHDGTLVDSEAVHLQHWNAVLAPLGVALDEALFESVYAGMPSLANAQDLVQRFGLSESPQVLSARKNDLTRDWLADHAFPLMPGAREVLLQWRSRGVRLAVVTGARQYAVDALLRWHDLGSVFELTVCADDVAHNKPAPDVYRHAAARLGLAPAECVAFEDTCHGLAAAASAGVPCVAVPTRYSAGHDFSRAQVVVGSLAEGLNWVDRVAAA